MIDSSGNETYKEITQTPGGYYPTYDKCNKKGDPKEGCLLTKARYYDEDIIWMAHENHHIIYDPNGNIILDNKLDGSLNYTRTPKEMGCRNHLYLLIVFSLYIVILVKNVVMKWTVIGIPYYKYVRFAFMLIIFVTVW